MPGRRRGSEGRERATKLTWGIPTATLVVLALAASLAGAASLRAPLQGARLGACGPTSTLASRYARTETYGWSPRAAIPARVWPVDARATASGSRFAGADLASTASSSGYGRPGGSPASAPSPRPTGRAESARRRTWWRQTVRPTADSGLGSGRACSADERATPCHRTAQKNRSAPALARMWAIWNLPSLSLSRWKVARALGESLRSQEAPNCRRPAIAPAVVELLRRTKAG